MERHKSDAQLAQLLACQMRHSFKLAEDHHFAFFAHDEVGHDLAELLELGRMMGLLVE